MEEERNQGTMGDMEISYRRNAGTNYMILPQEGEVADFEEEMLRNNDIPVLLTFFSMRSDGRRELWYDITAKKSLRHLYEQETVERNQLCAILLGVLEAYKQLGDYLISDTRIRLMEDTLYLSGKGVDMKVFLCFAPGQEYSFVEQLTQLYEYLMPLIDAEDETLVKLIYEGYQFLMDGSFSLEQMEQDLRDALMPEMGSSGSADDNRGNRALDLPEMPETQTRVTEDEPSQEDEKRRAILDELYEDDEEESFAEKIKQFFAGIPAEIAERLHKKKTDYFPPKDLEEDLVYDPSESLPAPTVLLSEDAASCFGKLLYEGEGEEKDFVLDKKEYRIGSRDERNDILLHSSAVSRHHARIWKEGKEFFIEDLNSTNGTYINGEPVNVNEPRKLQYMDKVSFADVSFRMV